ARRGGRVGWVLCGWAWFFAEPTRKPQLTSKFLFAILIPRTPRPMSEAQTLEEQNIHSLLQLTLAPGKADFERIFSLTPAEREDFLRLADSHHVVLRALVPIARRAAVEGNMEVAAWAEAAIAAEQLRIEN